MILRIKCLFFYLQSKIGFYHPLKLHIFLNQFAIFANEPVLFLFLQKLKEDIADIDKELDSMDQLDEKWV